MRDILLTGATGNLGAELLATLLDDSDDVRVRLLVRARDQAHATERVGNLLAFLYSGVRRWTAATRVTPLRGDILKERLGLDPATYESVAREVSQIIHAAASVDFTLPLEAAQRVNLEGTRNILELARESAKHRLERLVYVSTYTVCGDRRGHVLEDDLEAGQGFHNTYEHTKYLAELAVREAMDEVPISVVRPGVVTGDSLSGRVRSFAHFYYFLKIAYFALHPLVMPGGARNRVQLVPSDFVAAATAEILRRPDALGATFHLTAGSGAPAMGDIARLVVQHINRFREPDEALGRVWFLPPWFFRYVVRPVVRLFGTGRLKRLYERGYRFVPYLNERRTFDTSKTDRLLAGTGISVPALPDYFGRLIEFGVATRWGRRRLTSEELSGWRAALPA